MVAPTDRMAGFFLLLAAAATVVSVNAGVSREADFSTFAETLAAIAQDRQAHYIGGAARSVSGIAFMAAGWRLQRGWAITGNPGNLIVPIAVVMSARLLFIMSGMFTAISGGAAVYLAYAAPGLAGSASGMMELAGTYVVEYLRWSAGSAGFTAAGPALVLTAWVQWSAGGVYRAIAPASAIIGAAMPLIWIDAATSLHRYSGMAFLAWLVVMGLLLLAGLRQRSSAATATGMSGTG